MNETPTDWKPIETAPQDGTSILVWDSAGARVVFGCFYLPWGKWQNNDTFRQIKRPTHWMPMPGKPTRRRMAADMKARIEQSQQRDRYIAAISAMRGALMDPLSPLQRLHDAAVELLDALLDVETGRTR